MAWDSFEIVGSRGGDPFWQRGKTTLGWIGEIDGTRYGDYLGHEYVEEIMSWPDFWKRVEMLIQHGALTYSALREKQILRAT